MLFNKNKNNNPSASFRPALLTPQNFDNFAKKYSLPTQKYPSDIPYTTPER